MFLVGHDIGHDLAGMGAVRQPVDDRHGGVFGQFEQHVLLEGADHDEVDIARQHAGGVGDGLAMAELHFGAREHHGLPPICRTPTSKETRVRVEGFSKISATMWSLSGWSSSGAPLGRPLRAAFIAWRCRGWT
jgi:hypothetical protein